MASRKQYQLLLVMHAGPHCECLPHLAISEVEFITKCEGTVHHLSPMMPTRVGSDSINWLGLWWLAKVVLHELIDIQLDIASGTSKA